MKYLLLSFLIFFQILNTQAQNGDAPNFIVTDIEGNSHELYEVLASNKIVVLDFFTTWCGPCWNMHQDHVLEDLLDSYGEDGTNQLAVLSIECDHNTDLDDIYGTGSGTLGNWTEGISYPIINDSLISVNGNSIDLCNEYGVDGYPSIFIICPDKTYKRVNWQSTTSGVENARNNCMFINGQNNLSITEYIGVKGVICDATTIEPSIVLRNDGFGDVTSAAVHLKDGLTSELIEEMKWEGNLKSFDSDTIHFTSFILDEGQLDFEVRLVNNTIDDIPESNQISTIFSKTKVTENNVAVNVMTDEYGEETYWAILNGNGDVVAEGGNKSVGLLNNSENSGNSVPNDADAYSFNQLYTTNVSLTENDCYEFVIADYFSDGLCCGSGAGFFNVLAENGDTLISSQDFDHQFRELFTRSGVLSTSDEINFDEIIKIHPNPASDQITVAINEQVYDDYFVSIATTTGSILYKKAFNTLNSESYQIIDVSNLTPGIYLIRLISSSAIITKKVVIN